MQIFECVQRFLQRTISWTWERVAYNVNTMNGCEHYKVGQFQRLVLLTHSLACKYVLIFKEFVTDYSKCE